MIKKAFTIFELMLVIALMWIIFGILWKSFIVNDKDLIKSQTCANNLYGQVQQYVLFAQTWRKVNEYDATDSDGWHFPSNYWINFNVGSDTIVFWFDSMSQTNKTINLKGEGSDSKYSCYDANSYYLNLTWSNLAIQMNKQFEWWLNRQPFLINNDNTQFTWAITLEYVPAVRNDLWTYVDKTLPRRPIAKIVFDKRTQWVLITKCLAYENGWRDCKNWSK